MHGGRDLIAPSYVTVSNRRDSNWKEPVHELFSLILPLTYNIQTAIVDRIRTSILPCLAAPPTLIIVERAKASFVHWTAGLLRSSSGMNQIKKCFCIIGPSSFALFSHIGSTATVTVSEDSRTRRYCLKHIDIKDYQTGERNDLQQVLVKNPLTYIYFFVLQVYFLNRLSNE